MSLSVQDGLLIAIPVLLVVVLLIVIVIALGGLIHGTRLVWSYFDRTLPNQDRSPRSAFHRLVLLYLGGLVILGSLGLLGAVYLICQAVWDRPPMPVPN